MSYVFIKGPGYDIKKTFGSPKKISTQAVGHLNYKLLFLWNLLFMAYKSLIQRHMTLCMCIASKYLKIQYSWPK
jgi:hypothetical protein